MLRAVASGAHAVELDVQQLGDGTLLVHHDSSLVVDGERRRLAEMTFDQFVHHTAGAPWTFAQMLDLLSQLSLGLYLDVKRVTAESLVTLLDEVSAGPLAERTVVGSFDPELVRVVADDGRLRASLLYRDTALDPLTLAADTGCTLVHPCFDEQPWMVPQLAGAWMARVHDAGLALVGWNSNDAQLLQAMRAAGFDAVCTDDPRLLSSL